MLFTQGQATAPGPVFVGVGAVGIEAIGESIGELAELLGSMLGPHLRQINVGLLAGGGIDPAGQLLEEAPDHRDLAGPELPGPLGGRGGGQHRGQRFPGQPVPRAQIGGFVNAPAGLSATDQRPFGDRMRQLAAQFLRRWPGGRAD